MYRENLLQFVLKSSLFKCSKSLSADVHSASLPAKTMCVTSIPFITCSPPAPLRSVPSQDVCVCVCALERKSERLRVDFFLFIQVFFFLLLFYFQVVYLNHLTTLFFLFDSVFQKIKGSCSQTTVSFTFLQSLSSQLTHCVVSSVWPPGESRVLGPSCSEPSGDPGLRPEQPHRGDRVRDPSAAVLPGDGRRIGSMTFNSLSLCVSPESRVCPQLAPSSLTAPSPWQWAPARDR